MRLIVVSGFLGSGKTSLILRMARVLSERGLKVAIVENEIGEVGIDGKYLRDKGLQVRELFGGCICCTLATDLVFTLREINDKYSPDWTIVEPTGMATPAQVTDNVTANMPQVRELDVVCVVDAPRWDMLSTMMTPLVTGQMENADTVAVNKVDLVSEDQAKHVVDAIRALKPGTKILAISAETGQNVESVMEAFT